MAESVQDLLVRLSFDHGDTKSQIGAIRNEIRLLDSGFQAAAAQAGGFSSALDKSAARGKLLEQQIKLQEMAVQKYGAAIQQAQGKMESAQKRQADYTQKLSEARTRHDELTRAIEKARDALQKSGDATGENTDEYRQLSDELDRLETELKQNDNAIQTWERGLQRTDAQIVSAEKNVQRLTTEQNKSREAIGRMQTELNGINPKLEEHRQKLQAASDSLKEYAEHAKGAGEKQEAVGKTLSKGTAAIVGAGAAAVGTAVQWESSMADVTKTVSGTKEQLDGIETGLLEMSKNKPVDASTLAEIAANAGQLGIWTDNVLSFTGVMADLASTTNLTAEEGASAFAKFANITGMAQTDFDRLGSVVVDLGNNLATTEADIVALATNLASAGTQAGMSEAQIMGIAGALSSLGLEAASGGTAFSKLFINMQVAAETGGEELEKFAAVAGMSAQQFAQAFKQDAAGAVTAFVQGLSSGSRSAIVMLDEMGIKETRFRDALLRTSNASELFSGAIERAGNAWQSNTALATEAAVRYETTASKLTMMGNQAKSAALQFGKDLMPALQKGMDFVQRLLDKFSALDEGQRRQILTWGAYAAAVGPTIMMIGKANTAIGGIASGLSSLAGSAAAAGGGLTGVLSALGGLLGPAGIAAAAAAAGVLVYKFADWATGAKAAREATEQLRAEAQSWQEVQATTMYDTGNGDPLARFGLTKDAFAGAKGDAESWLSELNAVWTDGKAETDEMVAGFVDGFTGASDRVREAIASQQGLLEGYDALTPEAQAQMEADLAQLEAWDGEVEALLKKRQNGFLTEEEQARLQEIIDKRGEIEVKYSLDTENGYDQIVTQMQATVERAAHGGRVDEDLYGDTMNALAEGRNAYNAALDASYNAEYAQISAIEDESARMAALAALNERYQQQRQAGEEAYQSAVREAGTQIWESSGYDEQIAQLDELAGMMGDLENLDLTAISDFASGLDEGKLASMVAMVEQLKASGMTDEELSDLGIDYDGIMQKIEAIKEAAGSIEGLEPLSDMFGGALPEEIQRIMVGLDMTQAAQDWEAFANGESLTKIKAGVEPEQTEIDLTGNITQVSRQPGVTFEVDGSGKVTGVTTAQGVKFTCDGDGKITGVSTASGLTFSVDGSGNVTSVTMPDGESIDLTGSITQVSVRDGVKSEVDAEGKISSVTTAEGVTFTCDGAGNITGVTTAEGVTFSANGTGSITSVSVEAGVTMPVFSAAASIVLNPLDQAAITAWEAANSGITLAGPKAKVSVGLGDNWQSALQTAFSAGTLAVYGADGLPLTVTPQLISTIQASDIVALDADGTLHVIITPEVGSSEGVEEALAGMNENQAEGTVLAPLSSSTQEDVDRILQLRDAVQEYQEMAQGAKDAGDLGLGAMWDQSALDTTTEMRTQLEGLSEIDLENMATQAANLMAALSSGELDEATTAEYAAQLQQIVDVITAADQYLGPGNNVSAGIAEGMTQYGWSGDASTVAQSLTDAINAALGAHSPATALIPTGTDVSEGIAEGMKQFSFAPAASVVSAGLTGALSALPAQGTDIGTRFAAGLSQGLTARLPGIVAQAQAAANQIAQAFRTAWQIHSPSKVAEKLTDYFGQGLEKGMKGWPSVSRGLLEGDLAALYGAPVIQRTDSHDVTNTTNNLNFAGLTVRNDRDVQALSRELYALVKKERHGTGGA